MPGTSTDILPLTHCPDCLYELVGLPRRHRCPECRYEYDETMSLVWIWAKNEEPQLARIVMSVIFLLCGIVALPLYGFGGGFTTGHWTAIVMPVALTPAMIGWFFHLRTQIRNYKLRDEARASRALVISPRGYMVIGDDRGPLMNWETVVSATMRKLSRGRWRIRIRRTWPSLFLSGWRSAFGGRVLKATCKASPEEAEAFRDRMVQFIDQAKRKPDET